MAHKRVILGILLFLLLFSLLLYYNVNVSNQDPGPYYILHHFEQFNGTKVAMGGAVTSVDRTNHTLLVQVDPVPEFILLRTTESLNTTQPGDIVEVYGPLTSRTQMTAEHLLIYAQWANTLIFIRSLPAIPFVLFLFFRTYRFNQETHRFERRKQYA